MGVYIKGMEMPESCSKCFFKHLTLTEYDYCLATKKAIKIEKKKRQPDCPITELPPHGRLIDEQWLKDAMITTLEALKKNPKMDRQEMHLIAAFDTLRVMVEDAPTVIPAEEGE